MALVNAFRFDRHSGGICVDEESWHLMRRKTYFSDCLYRLVPQELAHRTGLELVYGGVGHPPFHLEVAQLATARLEERWGGEEAEPARVTATEAARLVLDAFRETQRRRIDDRLRFLFGFDLDQFNSGAFHRLGEQVPIRNQEVLQRATEITGLKENLGYGELSPPNQACLVALDPERGYEGFCIKDKDGVLSFHSCGFETLGMGRYASATRFAKELNEKWLSSRREGPGALEGVWLLLSTMIEAFSHFGQVGGNIRMILLDSRGMHGGERLSEVADERARLALELVRAGAAGLLPVDQAKGLLEGLILKGEPWEGIESAMFSQAPEPQRLDALLRGYKVEEHRDLPVINVLGQLYQGEAS